ncbi:MAG TPA: glycoside hydrolase family 2 TIM barrel-domain containing protein [Clostridia bacterium]
MSKVIPFNFGWKFKNGFLDDYKFKGIEKDCEVVDIPHTVKILQKNYFDEKDYQNIYTYCYEFGDIKLNQNQMAVLRFEGVANYCEVYFNGHLAGTHKGAYLPFEFDITSYLGKRNKLIVKVDASENPDIPPFGGVVDYLVYGGIYREVSLNIISKKHIKKVFISSDIHKGNLVFDILLSDLDGNLFININDKGNQYTKSIEIINNHIVEEINIPDYKLWDIDNPYLYDVEIKYVSSDGQEDIQNYKTGFREIKFTEKGFYLNGKKIKLLGLNRHQSYEGIGYAAPKRMQEADALFLKNFLGVNIVRTSHYPQSVHFLNKCDEIGLLVMEEIPGWQHIGNKDWQEISIRSVQEMIERDYNHPSIIIWGVRINESMDNDELYSKTNDLAHKLDQTRPTFGVRFIKKSHLLEDVYTYNDFTLRDGSIIIEKPKDVAPKNAPYMITEHNGHMFPTKKFDNSKRQTDFCLRHAKVINEFFKNDRISGCLGWCMSDYNTHKDFGSGDGICYHGVSDIYRRPKPVAYVYVSQYGKQPVLHISSDMHTGDYDAADIGDVYAFTNCDFVRVFKNNQFIKDFYPSNSPFKNMPHPPILIDDFIGELIEKNEKFSKKDANKIKELLIAFSKNSFNLSIVQKLKMFILMKKYKLTMQDATNLYGKYIGNWGQQLTQYRFEGYIDGKCVIKVIKGKVYKPVLKVEFDSKTLAETHSYDMTGVYITLTDENGNVLPYANNVVTVITDEKLSVIGNNQKALSGGTTGFYLKTKGVGGQSKIKIKVSDCQEYEDIITIDVSKSYRNI